MPALVLVRHGQALDPMQGGYDGLSERGALQAAKLGDALRAQAVARRFVGTLQRQILTAKFALGDATSATSLALLDEHHGHEAMTRVLADPSLADAETAALLADPARFTVGRAVASVVRGWALGRIRVPVSEGYGAFRVRVGSALSTLSDGLDGAQVALAFTSGGFIGAAVAQALGLDDAGAVDLGLQVDNASLTELRFSSRAPGKFALKRFNVVAHLPPELQTGI